MQEGGNKTPAMLSRLPRAANADVAPGACAFLKKEKCQGTAAWTGMLPLLPSGPGGVRELDIRGP